MGKFRYYIPFCVESHTRIYKNKKKRLVEYRERWNLFKKTDSYQISEMEKEKKIVKYKGKHTLGTFPQLLISVDPY